jgi:long-chain fatty acid transport protein
MEMNVHRGTRYCLTLAVLLAPALAGAQGFGLNEIGSCAVARASATTATGCRDASAIYWNPAALSSLQGNQILVGLASIAVSGDFTQDTTGRRFNGDIPVEFPPHLFLTMHPNASKWAFGIGAYVPYGLTSQWGNDFPGRFSALKASIQTIYAQPTVAYQLSKNWSIGGGPIFGHSNVELTQAIDLSQQVAAVVPISATVNDTITFARLGIAPGTEFGRARLKGSAWAYGFQLGVQGKLSPTVTVGARFMSKLDFKYDNADATFTQVQTNLVLGGAIPNPANPTGPPAIPAGTPADAVVASAFTTGPLVAQKVSTTIPHPAQAQVGISYTGYKDTEINFDYHWIGWKSFKNLPINFAGPAPDRTLIEDYNNASVARLGVERHVNSEWTLRGGASAATSAAPPETVTPLLPEQDRYTLGLGGGYQISKMFAVDASYLYVGVWGARGRIVERTSRSQTAGQLNTGFYRLRANIFSLSLKASY